MRIVQFLPTMRRAGAESVVAGLCRGLCAAGQEVHLVVAGGGFEYQADLADTPVRVHSLRLFEGILPFYRRLRRRRIVREIARRLEGIAPDVVHCHLVHGAVLAGPGAAGLGVPVFCTLHGLDPALNASGLRNWWRRREFTRAAGACRCRFLAVSRSVAELIERSMGRPAGSIAVQPNPIDLACWRPPEAIPVRPPPRIVMVGTLYPLKRVHVALEALKQLRADLGAALCIVGDGPERRRLEGLSRCPDLAGRTRFLGVRRDVGDILRASGAMWLLSEREGMPMVVVEAMASGVAVIATDVAGTNELVRDEENGLLVPLDDPQAVAAATERLWRDDALRRRLIAGGLETVRRFDLPGVVRGHLDHYRKALDRGV